jgi:hypothetical protein
MFAGGKTLRRAYQEGGGKAPIHMISAWSSRQKMWFRAVFEISTPHRHLGHGPDAHHGVRLVQDGVDLAAQAAGGVGAAGARTARPSYGVLAKSST